MQSGDADDTILVSLAYEYNIPGTANQFRDELSYKEQRDAARFYHRRPYAVPV